MKKIFVFAGTRPEVIKMVPVYLELKKEKNFNTKFVSTGQHKEMLEQALADFSIKPDINLSVMIANQSLSDLSANLFTAINKLLLDEEPDLVMLQGDTTTVQVAALASFYRQIKVAHVEAGLRSHDIHTPFPEELNRKITSLVSSWHFAPTEQSKNNLIDENIKASNILVAGNTVIDALLMMEKNVKNEAPEMPEKIQKAIDSGKRIILVTGHRRESFGQGFKQICTALAKIAKNYPDIFLIYPVHFNPNVRQEVTRSLERIPNIILEEPLSYRPFVYLMSSSYMILTDSGGIQEEGPSLAKPVLIMRDLTERPEGIEAGVNILVGTDSETIYNKVSRLLNSKEEYKKISFKKNPYGDGVAGQRIAQFIKNRL